MSTADLPQPAETEGSELSRQMILGKQDIAMVRSAIANGYPIDPKLRSSFIAHMKEILENDGLKKRTRLAAGRLILAADSINARREAIDLAGDRTDTGLQRHLHLHVELTPEQRERHIRAIIAEVQGNGSDTPGETAGHTNGCGTPGIVAD